MKSFRNVELAYVRAGGWEGTIYQAPVPYMLDGGRMWPK